MVRQIGPQLEYSSESNLPVKGKLEGREYFWPGLMGAILLCVDIYYANTKFFSFGTFATCSCLVQHDLRPNVQRSRTGSKWFLDYIQHVADELVLAVFEVWAGRRLPQKVTVVCWPLSNDLTLNTRLIVNSWPDSRFWTMELSRIRRLDINLRRK